MNRVTLGATSTKVAQLGRWNGRSSRACKTEKQIEIYRPGFPTRDYCWLESSASKVSKGRGTRGGATVRAGLRRMGDSRHATSRMTGTDQVHGQLARHEGVSVEGAEGIARGAGS